MLAEQHITTLVDRLVKDELVTVERYSRDRRFINVSLTDKGRETLMQAIPAAREVVNQVMLSISEGDSLLLEKLLRVLRENAHHELEQIAKRA